MSNLSISKAWDESKAILAREGRLLMSVALALVALPSLIAGLVNPAGIGDASSPLTTDIIVIAVSLISIAGQLALIRLALPPSLSVGEAIGHGFRRLPVYFVAALIMVAGFILLAIPFAVAAAALGEPMNAAAASASPGFVAIALLYLAAVFLVAVRLIMSSAVATAEAAGPIAILKRSWALSAGHWLRLLGFVIAFVVGAMILFLAVVGAVGAVAGLMLGPIEPMSASALVVALVQALITAALTVVFTVMLARIYAQLSGREAVG
jgi:hypothetical protein